MSGGSYDYAFSKLGDIASTLRSRHPHCPYHLALARQFDVLSKVMHAVEWADSGDKASTDGGEAIRRLLFDIDPRPTVEEARIMLARQIEIATEIIGRINVAKEPTS